MTKKIYPLSVFILILIWILYKIVGYSIIASMYYGQSFSFLNNLIQGQDSSSLEIYINLADNYMEYTLTLIFILIIALWFIMSLPRIIINYKEENNWFVCDYSFIESISKNKINYLIAISSGCALFIELMIIRLHSSYFQLFAYFKNISLLSCFLGRGIGYALSQKKILLPLVIPLLTIQI